MLRGPASGFATTQGGDPTLGGQRRTVEPVQPFNEQLRLRWLAGIIAMTAMLGLGACSDSADSGTIAPNPAPAPSSNGSGGATDTTSGSALTEPEATTTTPVTTATSSPPTTTIPRPGGLVLLGDGIGPLAFGATPEAAIEFLSAALGQPMADSGWTDPFSVYGTCPGTVVRGVEWPGFLALFGDPESGGGERHFMAYTVGWFGSDPFGLRTEQGTAVGDSRDEVAAENLAATFVAAEGPFPPTVVIGTERGDIVGSFTEDGAELITISAGTACGE